MKEHKEAGQELHLQGKRGIIIKKKEPYRGLADAAHGVC